MGSKHLARISQSTNCKDSLNTKPEFGIVYLFLLWHVCTEHLVKKVTHEVLPNLADALKPSSLITARHIKLQRWLPAVGIKIL